MFLNIIFKKKTARRRSEFREKFKLYAVFLLDDFV